ncbi:MAG: tetratricopeptide repeat protein [Candidatus Omnitrophica bacterium]|nr:tetratricopeptide repeat protein [Candidatus Omnitrophota bacterium]
MFCLLTAPYVFSQTNASPKDTDSLARSIFRSFELFEEGRTLYTSGKIQDAKAKFTEALEKDPKNSKAREYLNLCSGGEKTSQKEPSAENASAANVAKTVDKIEQRIKLIERKQTTKSLVSDTELDRKFSDFFKLTASPSGKEKIEKARKLFEEGERFYNEAKYDMAYTLYTQASQVLSSD